MFIYEKLHCLYGPPCTIMVTEWKKKRHMSSSGAGDIHRRFWRRFLSVIELLEVLDFDGRIILMWTIKKWNGARIGLMWLRIGKCEAVMTRQFPKH